MNEKNQPVHVQLDNPVKLRKDILNCAIRFNECLMVFESSKIVRARKEYYKKQINGLFKELKNEVKELIDNLPEVDIKEPKTVNVMEIINKPEAVKEAPDNFNKFDAEIAEIKNRLKSL